MSKKISKTNLELKKGEYWLDEEAKRIRISVLKAETLENLKKDQIMMHIVSPNGMIDLIVNDRILRELKKELYRYEAIYLGKKPKIMNRKIRARDVAWRF
jgi:hypothetical protein